jgi:peptidoglycan/LPS O-acetylase OafA/YrhL
MAHAQQVWERPGEQLGGNPVMANASDQSNRHPTDSGTGDVTDEARPFHLGYRRWLDGLRGVAILLVLGFHVELISGGSFGVDIFFVLSGFLITSLLVEEWGRRGSISLRHFYLRRGLRLLPAFLTLLLVGFLYNLLFQPTEEAALYRKEMVLAACYLSNWHTLHCTDMGALSHTWSLSVEEQFYLIWPLLLYGMLRMRLAPRTILPVVLAGILASASLRTVLFSFRPPDVPGRWLLTMRLYTGLDTRADALLTGCLVGLLATGKLLPRSRFFQVASGAGALISAGVLGYVFWHAVFYHHLYFYGLYTLVALMVAVILVRLLIAPSRLASWVLESRILVGVGRISYGIYLWNTPIIHWLRPARLGWTAPMTTSLAAGLSFAAAALSFYLIERPCLRMKLRCQSAGSDTPKGVVSPVQVREERAPSLRVAA